MPCAPVVSERSLSKVTDRSRRSARPASRQRRDYVAVLVVGSWETRAVTAERTKFDVWHDVFLKAYADPSVPSLHCPGCGAQSLHLVFEGLRSDEIRAITIFWCGSCMYGLAPNTAPVPDGATVTVSESPLAPDFQIIYRNID